jgi:hypothetical protein
MLWLRWLLALLPARALDELGLVRLRVPIGKARISRHHHAPRN